jgi:hypothetical protein
MKGGKGKPPRRLQPREGNAKLTSVTVSTPKIPSSPLYGTSPIKRHRRTSAEMENLLSEICGILNGEEGQITIRHLFYRVSSGLHLIPKTEAAYKNLCSHLSKWRRSGDISWSAFADNTRWHIRRPTFEGVQDALNHTVATYRRNLWNTQPYYIEVWVEKDSIAGIVAEAANSFGVPVFVCRGFASLSSLYSAANTFREATNAGKHVIIYHFGDYDPSGVAAGDSVMRAFRDDFKVDLKFVRAAVTEEQIQRLKLPTRPVKMSDKRAKKWTGGECVELDTMPPAEIRKLVESGITQHIDQREWGVLLETETMERETLRQLSRRAA